MNNDDSIRKITGKVQEYVNKQELLSADGQGTDLTDPLVLKSIAGYFQEAGIEDEDAAAGFLRDMMNLERDMPPAAVFFEYVKKTGDSGAIAVFAQGSEPLTERLKNYISACLTEQIRFAMAQKKNLSNTDTYNRHIEKTLDDMNFSLSVLFIIGSSLTETSFFLDKYQELTVSVNTPHYWNVYWKLKGQGVFDCFMTHGKAAFLEMFHRGNMIAQSLAGYISDGDATAQTALRELYEEFLEDDPAKAAAIMSSGLLNN